MTTTVTAVAPAYTVKQFIDATQLKADLSFSTADIHTAMMNQAQLLTHYGILAAKASRQVDDIKLLIENAEARVYRLLRDKAVADKEKVTEVQLEKQVSIQSQVVSFKRGLNEARQIEDICKVTVEAFRHRKDMLVQQGAYSREEMKGEMSMSIRNAGEVASAGDRQAILNKVAALRNAKAEAAA